LILEKKYVKINSNEFLTDDGGGIAMHDKVVGTDLPAVAALAYLGDSRLSVYVRRMLIEHGLCKSGSLNEAALGYVTAEAQAAAYEKIKRHLTEMESDTFRRAFNSSHLNKPKRASSKDYRCATGFEAIIGMLSYVGDEDRINELLEAATTEEGERYDTED
jgi:ribonuclease-3 family protein